jgi:phosphomevalonate kinase
MKKKSQLEMMGLVVIVIIIAMALLFVIQFVLTKQPSTLKKTYTYTELAANTLNAITKTNAVDCNNQEITQLLQDCASAGGYRGQIICDDGITDSCLYVNKTIGEMLDNTLKQWNKAYNFTADKAGISIANGNCSGERQQKVYPIPLLDASEPMLVTLSICG